MKVGRPFPFRWLLPTAEFLLCMFLLGPFWLGISRELWESLHPQTSDRAQPLDHQIYVLNLPRTVQEQRKQHILDMRLQLPAALNLPVQFVQIPYIVLGGKRDYVPLGVRWVPLPFQLPDFWRGFTWPFVGIIFWWMVGRSIDALIAARKRATTPHIRWLEAILGLCFALLGAGIFAVRIGDGTESLIFPLVGVGGALWSVLGTTMVVAFVIQWRLHRRIKNQTLPAASAPA